MIHGVFKYESNEMEKMKETDKVMNNTWEEDEKCCIAQFGQLVGVGILEK